jgi:antitoxin component of MazEF toxin-antitoxin module
MSERPITYTRKVAKSGNSFLMRIPKDIVNLLGIDENTFVEVTLRVVGKNKQEVENVKNR